MDLHRKIAPFLCLPQKRPSFFFCQPRLTPGGQSPHTHSIQPISFLREMYFVLNTGSPLFSTHSLTHPPYTVGFFVRTHLGFPALWKPPLPHCYHSDWPSWCDQVWHQTRTPAPCCGGSQGQWHFPGCSEAAYTQSDEATLVGYQFDWQRAARALALRIYRKTALEYLTAFDWVLPTIPSALSPRTEFCSTGSRNQPPGAKHFRELFLHHLYTVLTQRWALLNLLANIHSARSDHSRSHLSLPHFSLWNHVTRQPLGRWTRVSFSYMHFLAMQTHMLYYTFYHRQVADEICFSQI